MNAYPDHRSLYRLPWSLPDNPIAWLESTASCNMYCEGCYRANVKNGHKSLDDIANDLEVFERYRTFDGVSIAGGDPLVHPEIVEIVAMVARRGYKPILNTNGLALDESMLRDLARAGLTGFTFHVDSRQYRPGWTGKSEVELNELRLELAERVAAVGDISVAFNSTVYEDTLPFVPDLVEWAHRHVDKVHVMVFIAYRQGACDMERDVDFYVGSKRIDMNDLVYSRPAGGQRLDISSRDVVAEIRKRFPDFTPAAYLNGTERADSLKWLLTTHVGTPERIYGYVGPRFMELAQGLHHLRTGRWLAYAAPSTLRHGRRLATLASLLDPGTRGALGRYLGEAAHHPSRLRDRLYLQSVMIIQPIDILVDGGTNMCDACPDITVHQGELVWSCRLEERMRYGGFARGVAKKEAAEPKETEVPA